MSIGARRLPGPRKGTARRVIMRSRVRTCIEEGKKGCSESEESKVWLAYLTASGIALSIRWEWYTQVSPARRMRQFDTSGHRSR